MRRLKGLLGAVALTACFSSIALAGTITGSRTSSAGTITGSRAGTITGSAAGTITGSKTDSASGATSGTITGSRTMITVTQSEDSFYATALMAALDLIW